MTLHRTGQRTALAMIVIGVGVMLAECAHAQPICGPRAEIVGQIAEQWGEQRLATALTTPDQMIEVYVSPRTGTWTILSTTTDGVSCVEAAGDGWTEQPIGDGA